MKNGFSSLENKKLNNLKSVVGGRLAATNDRCHEATMGAITPGTADSATYIDGVKKFTMDME